MTRNASDHDVLVECLTPARIPLYRLVHFQVERTAPDVTRLPEPLQRGGKVLSAVYRVGPYRSSTGTPSGYAIRLLIDPASAPTSATRTDTPATMSVAGRA